MTGIWERRIPLPQSKSTNPGFPIFWRTLSTPLHRRAVGRAPRLGRDPCWKLGSYRGTAGYLFRFATVISIVCISASSPGDRWVGGDDGLESYLEVSSCAAEPDNICYAMPPPCQARLSSKGS